MGMRFRKSVKLAPGIRLNFSGSGLSWTLGAPGASLSVGPNGTFLGAGIAAGPTRMPINITVEENGELVFRDAAGTPIAQPLVSLAKRQHGAAIDQLIESACEKVNRDVEALGEIHLASPSPHEVATHQPVPFSPAEPMPPTPLQKGFWDKVFTQRWKAKALQNRLAHEKFEAEAKEWIAQAEAHRAAEDVRKTFIEHDILVSEPAMEKHLEAALHAVQWPRETHVTFDVSPDGTSVILDVDLPEIEDMPTRTASVSVLGYRLSIKEMGPVQRRKLYMAHVHGVGFRVVAEVFAALPTVQHVALSAYSQRVDAATGQVGDDYLYAVQVRRDDWAEINFGALENVDVVEALARFDLWRKVTKTGVFTAVEPLKGLVASRRKKQKSPAQADGIVRALSRELVS